MAKDRLAELLEECGAYEDVVRTSGAVPENVPPAVIDMPEPMLMTEIIDKNGRKIDVETAAEAMAFQAQVEYAEATGESLALLLKRQDEDAAIKVKSLKGANLSSKETFARMLNGFAMGLNDMELCAYLGIGRTTLAKWFKRMPSLVTQREALDGMPTLVAKQKVLEEIENDVEVAKWYLERRGEGFQTKSRQEITGKDGGPIQSVHINIT